MDVETLSDLGLVAILDLNDILPIGAIKEPTGLTVFFYADSPKLQAMKTDYQANRVMVVQSLAVITNRWSSGACQRPTRHHSAISNSSHVVCATCRPAPALPWRRHR